MVYLRIKSFIPLAMLLGAACLIAFNVQAAEVIKVNAAAVYADQSVGNGKVRSECDWDRSIVQYLVKYSKGRVQITDQVLDTLSGPTLRIEITNVHTAGGGGFSGPKWGYIRATLSENGTQSSTYVVGAHAQAGRGTACGTLNYIAKALGARLAKRLRMPKHHKMGEDTDNDGSVDQQTEGDDAVENEDESESKEK